MLSKSFIRPARPNRTRDIFPVTHGSEFLLMSSCLPCCHEARTENHSGGKQGLLSSGRKFAGSGFAVWPRRRTIIAAMAALVLLPIEVSDAGWLSDIFKRLVKARQIAKARHLAKASHLAKLPPRQSPTP